MALTCSGYFWEMNYAFWASHRLLQVIHCVVLFGQIVSRNALTVLQTLRMIREMHQSDWESLFFSPEPGSRNKNGKGGWCYDEIFVPDPNWTMMPKPRCEPNHDCCVLLHPLWSEHGLLTCPLFMQPCAETDRELSLENAHTHTHTHNQQMVQVFHPPVKNKNIWYQTPEQFKNLWQLSTV